MYILGIDIGGSRVKFGLFDKDAVLIEKWDMLTQKDNLFNSIAEELKLYLANKEITFDQIIGYGIGIPGSVKDNFVICSVNLGLEKVNVVDEFKKAIGYDALVSVKNDANLAALGEFAMADNDYNSTVFITLGTGVGGGVIIDHQIREGLNGICGEIGHMPIDERYRFNCCCGRRGCFETMVSAPGVIRLAKYHLRRTTEKSMLSNFYKFSAKKVFDFAKEGDAFCLKIVDEVCYNIAKGLAIISVTINPDAFIIGGGLSGAGDILIEYIKKHYENLCFSDAKDLDIILSKLGTYAGIYGAAYLIKDIINKKVQI